MTDQIIDKADSRYELFNLGHQAQNSKSLVTNLLHEGRAEGFNVG